MPFNNRFIRGSRRLGKPTIHQRLQLQETRLLPRAATTRVVGVGHAARIAEHRKNKCRRSVEVVMDETITNLNPLTPLSILRLFRPAGTLDALANCTALTDLNLLHCRELSGQSYARSASLSLTCTANRRDHQCTFTDTSGPSAHCSPQGCSNHSPNAPLSSHSTCGSARRLEVRARAPRLEIANLKR